MRYGRSIGVIDIIHFCVSVILVSSPFCLALQPGRLTIIITMLIVPLVELIWLKVVWQDEIGDIENRVKLLLLLGGLLSLTAFTLLFLPKRSFALDTVERACLYSCVQNGVLCSILAHENLRSTFRWFLAGVLFPFFSPFLLLYKETNWWKISYYIRKRFRPWNCDDPDVRLAAMEKLRNQKLIGKIANGARYTDVRFIAIQRISSQDILSEIAKRTWNNSSSIRIAAIERLTSQGTLAEIAQSGKYQCLEERTAAAKRLTDQGLANSLLAEIAKEQEEIIHARSVTEAKNLVQQKKWDEAASLGSVAVDPLISALCDARASSLEVERIARSLGCLRDTRAIEPLFGVLKETSKSPSDHPCYSVAKAIIEISGTLTARVLTALIPKLVIDPYNVSQGAVKVLAEIGDDRAVKALLAAAKSYKGYGSEILNPLRRVHNPLAVKALVNGLSDSTSDIREACADALAGMCNDKIIQQRSLTTEVKEKIETTRIKCILCGGSGIIDLGLSEEQAYYAGSNSEYCTQCRRSGYYYPKLSEE